MREESQDKRVSDKISCCAMIVLVDMHPVINERMKTSLFTQRAKGQTSHRRREGRLCVTFRMLEDSSVALCFSSDQPTSADSTARSSSMEYGLPRKNEQPAAVAATRAGFSTLAVTATAPGENVLRQRWFVPMGTRQPRARSRSATCRPSMSGIRKSQSTARNASFWSCDGQKFQTQSLVQHQRSHRMHLHEGQRSLTAVHTDCFVAQQLQHALLW